MKNNDSIEPNDFGLPSEHLVKIDNLIQVDETQRFIQVGDGNLIYIKELLLQGMTGAIQAFVGTTTSKEWLLCNGDEYFIEDYPELAEYLKDTYGKSSSEFKFKIPDFRGVFLRSLDNGKGYDKNRQLGSFQGDTFQNHTHTFKANNTSSQGTPYRGGGNWMTRDANITTSKPSGNIGDETRPKNFAVNYFIHI